MYTILQVISQTYMPSTKDLNDASVSARQSSAISGLAALITLLMNGQAHIQDALVEWLAGASGSSTGVDGSVRRAVVAALAYDYG